MSSRESDEQDENGADARAGGNVETKGAGVRAGGNVETKGATQAPPSEESGEKGDVPSKDSDAEKSPKQ